MGELALQSWAMIPQVKPRGVCSSYERCVRLRNVVGCTRRASQHVPQVTGCRYRLRYVTAVSAPIARYDPSALACGGEYPVQIVARDALESALCIVDICTTTECLVFLSLESQLRPTFPPVVSRFAVRYE